MTPSWEEGLDIRGLLLQLGENLDREGLRRTPERVASAWLEFLEGYTLDPEKILQKTFDAENTGLQVCRDIGFTSMCEHHLLPFFGVCHIGYVPNGRVAGLSKLARLVDCFAHRLQIQERMTKQIAESIWDNLQPVGVFVIVKAKHLCCHGRGIRRSKMEFATSTQRGNIDPRLISLLLGKE